MGFWSKLFGGGSARAFCCRGCGKEYRIGVDSAIMTSDELLGAFAAGDSVLFGMSASAKMPDTIGACEYGSMPLAKAKEIRRDNEEALRKADADPARLWRCNKCSNRQLYADEPAEPPEPPASNTAGPKVDPASIKVKCAKCKKALKVKPALIGKRIKCPGCGSTQSFEAEVS